VNRLKRILILGGGFAGIEVLRKIQHAFRNDHDIHITLVSRDNFFLFTPMLPEVAAGTIETRNIAISVRAFCKRARFYEATVDSIDLEKKEVLISHKIKSVSFPRLSDITHTLSYDYLVIAIGSETNFFGMDDVANSAFTMKSLGDAILIRNRVIDMLERAELEKGNSALKRKLLTFVVVGGGFAGVETAGQLNESVHESVKEFYHSIDEKDIRIVLMEAGSGILPEVGEDLSRFALEKLRQGGVDVMLESLVTGMTFDGVSIKGNPPISTFTLIWAAGVTSGNIIKQLPCDHDKGGRIVVNSYLEVEGYDGVYSLGDCASLIDLRTGRSYPPTAQCAISQASIAAKNLISAVRGNNTRHHFEYKSKGVMAVIGRRSGVGILMRLRVQGLLAWSIWRAYYLARLPTTEKKLRVGFDWMIDVFFKPDISRLKIFTERQEDNIW
jgi:NADH dehydrogenase